MFKLKNMIFFALLFTFFFSLNQSNAQSIKFNARGGYYEKADNFFLGAGVNIKVLMFEIVPNAEYVFVSNGNLYTLNLDGQFNIISLPLVSGWIGGGLATVFAKPENGDTQSKAGFNLLAGFGIDAIPLSPYIQAKYIFTTDNQFVIAAGVRF